MLNKLFLSLFCGWLGLGVAGLVGMAAVFMPASFAQKGGFAANVADPFMWFGFVLALLAVLLNVVAQINLWSADKGSGYWRVMLMMFSGVPMMFLYFVIGQLILTL